MDGLSWEKESLAKSAKPSGVGAFSFYSPPTIYFQLILLLWSLIFRFFDHMFKLDVYFVPEKNENDKETFFIEKYVRVHEWNLIQNIQRCFQRRNLSSTSYFFNTFIPLYAELQNSKENKLYSWRQSLGWLAPQCVAKSLRGSSWVPTYSFTLALHCGAC